MIHPHREASASEEPGWLFVYGTLLPGEVRWGQLEQWVVDEGFPDTVRGELFDTGLAYPAARFDGDATIHGRTFALLAASRSRCLEHLDEVEGTVLGLYRRTIVTTGHGVRAWSYEYGAGLDLVPIPGGDWSRR